MSVSRPACIVLTLLASVLVLGSSQSPASDVSTRDHHPASSLVDDGKNDRGGVSGSAANHVIRTTSSSVPEDNDSKRLASESVIRNNKRTMSSAAASEQSTSENPDAGLPTKLSDLSKDDRSKLLSSLEASFLNILGLKSRPRPATAATIPEYMMELYKEHLRGRRAGKSRHHKAGLHNSNTIRSFFQQDDDDSDDNVVRLRFNISSLPTEESLRAAEIRLYRSPSSANGSSPAENLSRSTHRVDIYQILRPPRRSEGQEAITRLLDTQTVDPTAEGWVSLDVTPALHHWRTHDRNYGLEARFSKLNGDPTPLKHIRFRRSLSPVHDKPRNWDAPLLVTYSDDSKDQKARSRRDATSRNNRDTRRKRNSRNKERRKKRKDKPRKHRDYKKNCRRKPLYVDFDDVGWQDWIVAPPGYEAFYCFGECPFHLPEHLNTTNHAVVQQFVNSVDPQAVPKACCVPTELSEVSLLYIDDENNVVLGQYEEMVVEACGCR